MNYGSDLNTVWAVVMMVVIPAIIIAAAEVDERLRQRESPLRPAALMIRNWALPFFALWALLVAVLGVESETLAVRAVGSGLVLSIAAAVLRILRVFIDGIRHRPRTVDRRAVPQLLLALPRLMVVLVAAWLLVGSVWGVDLSAALTALGVTSLVISFALQDTLSGLAAGLLLLSDQPFQPGDWIEAGDLEGQVVDVNWRTSRLRTRNGDTITVPNGQLANASIVNFSSPEPKHRVVVGLQVAFANPPTLAKAMLLDAAKGTPGVLSDPPPNVVVVQIDDPLMGYEVHMWVDDYAIVPRVKSDFGALVWYQSNRHNVPLPSPAQDLFLWDGVQTSAAGEPTLAEVRQLLQQAPILGGLDDGDIDRLAKASSLARYAVGEYLLDSRSPTRNVLVMTAGTARLVVRVGDDGDAAEITIGDLGQGELIDLATSTPGGGENIAVRALTDCEVVIVDPDVVGEVGSRNAELAAAFNQVASLRRRRIERVTDRRAMGAAVVDSEGREPAGPAMPEPMDDQTP